MVESFFHPIAGMLSFWPTVFLLAGLGVTALKYGADWLVSGAANLGFRFGISAAMIGLTVVAFGTSAPELVVSVMTAAQGKPEICLGNVIGSNVANTLLILGCTALVFPLVINRASLKSEVPQSFAAILIVFVLAILGPGLSRLDGFLLLAIFASWMIWVSRKTLLARREQERRNAENASQGLESEAMVFHRRHWWIDLSLIVIGLVLLVLGADLLVVSAVSTARALSIPEVVVGLTLVAIGTSLPELAVSLVAAWRRQTDMAVSNVMGSNIFNALLILGAAALISPISLAKPSWPLTPASATLGADIPFCVLACGMIWPLMAHRKRLSRFQGGFLLVLYTSYLGWLVLRSI